MQPYLGYTFILLVCLVIALVAFNKVNQRYYPWILYGMGAGMVLMTTLAGPYLVGSDIHGEYYVALLNSGEDVWKPLWDYPQATAIGNSIIAPLLYKVFYIPLLWVYKVVYPLLFASVPVLLYLIFAKWLPKRQAFLASSFFIIFPAFALELPTIPRQLVSETFLALTLFLIIVSNLRFRYRIPLIIVCGLLTMLTHYAVGIILLIFLGLGLIIKLGLRVKEGLPSWAIGVVLVVLLVGSTLYFATAGNGIMVFKLSGLYNHFVPGVLEVDRVHPPARLEAPQPTELTTYPVDRDWTPTRQVGPGIPTPKPIPKPKAIPLVERYTELVRIVLGYDFVEVSTPGKLVRILQWIVVLFIPVGLWRMRRIREYWIFASGTILILALCLVPGFAPIMNATRFFHLSLFMLAPTFVVGGMWVCRKPQIFTLCILIPYFLFTSGFVFEVAKIEDVSKIDVPYSIAISDYRIDLGATFTENDVKVRDWIATNGMGEFTMVVIPDTQEMSQWGSDEFYELTQWIVDNKDELNIKFVVHVGDIVNMGTDTTQWGVADKAMSSLDGVVPYLVVPGNKDYNYTNPYKLSARNLTNYNTYFGPSRFNRYEWFGGNYPTDSMANSYGYFTTNGVEFLVMGLEFYPTAEMVDWAKSILDINLDKHIILFTHAYLYLDGSRIDSKDYWRPGWYLGGYDGEELWANLISQYPNIVMVASGHVPHEGVARRTDYLGGEPINQVLQNYQAYPESGEGANEGGWLRYYTFNLGHNEIEATTYSPYLDAYWTGSNHQFTLPFREKKPQYQATFPLYSDMYTAYFVAEKVSYRPGINHKLPKGTRWMPEPPYYVFVRERNVWDNKVAIWTSVGCRKYPTLEEYGININENIIYQVGDARVLYMEEK